MAKYRAKCILTIIIITDAFLERRDGHFGFRKRRPGAGWLRVLNGGARVEGTNRDFFGDAAPPCRRRTRWHRNVYRADNETPLLVVAVAAALPAVEGNETENGTRKTGGGRGRRVANDGKKRAALPRRENDETTK